MDKHPHIIGRQIFDIDFPSKEAAEVLQDKISSIFNNRLMDEMNILFDKIIPSNRIIKLDTLSIDIGSIDFSSLETELPDRLIQKLEQELRLILLHDNAAPASDSPDVFQDDKKGNYLQLLEFFLLKGSFPWWVSGTEGPELSEVLEFLLLNSSLKLKALIMRVGQNAYARKRLVYQFSEQQIKYIIVILEPEEAEFIFDYHQNITQIQNQVVLVKNEESDFKKAVWELILSYLIVDKGSHFNRKEFVRSMLRGMAAHFNTDFSELLAMFAAGLKSGSSELRNIDSLQSIVLELFLEAEPLSPKDPFKAEKTNEKDPLKLSGDLDQLRYYLTFGSFPWWSSYPDKQALDRILIDFLNFQPKTIALLLRNIGQQQYTRKLLVKSFSEEILLSVISVLEPDQVEFISDYIAEAKDLNKQESKLKVQGQDLAEAVWEFVLAYLLADRGSEFNRQRFLESNILNLANRFNVSYSDILVFLVQSIGVRHHASTRHISLIRDLSALYTIRVQETNAGLIDVDDTAINALLPEIIESKGLRDVLYYWLKLGHFPWWGAKYSESGPSGLLEQLIRESIAEALLFFKFSGQSLSGRRRMLNQISIPILFKLFRNLTEGNKALRYAESVLLLFSGSPLFHTLERKRLEQITLASLWDMYAENSYESFKSGSFLKAMIINLSVSSDISFQKIASFLNSLVLDKQIRTQLNRVFRSIEENGESFIIYATEGHLPVWSALPDIELMLTEQLRLDNFNPELITVDKVFNEASFILRYFLQYNKLPDKYKLSSRLAVNDFLKQLLIFLYKNRFSDLDRILNSEKYAAENLFRLHDIFSKSDSIEESNLKNLLATKFEKNILLFIRQKGGISLSEKSLVQFIGKLAKNPLTEANTAIFKLLFKYPSVSAHFSHFFKDSLVYEFLEADHIQGGYIPEEIRSLNTWLAGLLKDRLDRERLELFIRNYNLMIFGGIIQTGNITSYLKQFLDFLAAGNYQLMLKITSAIKRSPESSNESIDVLIRRIPELDQFLSDYKKINDLKDELKSALGEAEKALVEQLLKNNPDELREGELRQLKQELKEQEQMEQKKSADEILSDKEPIYVHNAGLVILHPFLSTYFNRLNMFENGDFKTEELRHRAVHLLQYLAFGTENNEEHELVLNKILCNIPIEEPLSAGIVMTANEIAVSAELLNAILVQWDKLKNTSPESFQASFLQRDGALSRMEENWNLKVETRGYDVLLNTLPWGLGMIKTSWMPEFIYVEWI